MANALEITRCVFSAYDNSVAHFSGGNVAASGLASLASSVVSSLVGLGANNWSKANANAVMIAAGGLSGGLGSVIGGGDFWAGARNGLIVAGLNHAAHMIEEKALSNYVEREYGVESEDGFKRVTQPIEMDRNPELIMIDAANTERAPVNVLSNGFDGNGDPTWLPPDPQSRYLPSGLALRAQNDTRLRGFSLSRHWRHTTSDAGINPTPRLYEYILFRSVQARGVYVAPWNYPEPYEE